MDYLHEIHMQRAREDSEKLLNDDIVKLKNFVARYKPNVNSYKKSADGYAQFKKDFEEWDNLMRL